LRRKPEVIKENYITANKITNLKKKNYLNEIFMAPTAVLIKPQVSCDVAPCQLVNIYRLSEKRSVSIFMIKQSRMVSQGVTSRKTKDFFPYVFQEMVIVVKIDGLDFLLVHSHYALTYKNCKPTIQVTSSDPTVILQ
jgi:hypothetical protein